MIPKQLTLTGDAYIKYVDTPMVLKMGDVQLYLNDDAVNPSPGNYENISSSGYIKAKVYDSKFWQNMDIAELCSQRENKFAKKQRAIDSALLCKEIIKNFAGTLLYKTYRAHYTINKYEPEEYITKANRRHKPKNLK